MLRKLSEALIIVLILICPLTFSTDKVPDFKPACDTHSPSGAKVRTIVAAIRCKGGSRSIISRRNPAPTHPLIPPVGPHIDTYRIPSCSRAPPPGLFTRS